jgi:hypothetical protein
MRGDIPGGIGATPGAIREETASATRIFPPKKGATEGKLRSRFWVARPGSTKTLFDPALTAPAAARTLTIDSIDKGTPGESRGRKATGPRLLRDADQ